MKQKLLWAAALAFRLRGDAALKLAHLIERSPLGSRQERAHLRQRRFFFTVDLFLRAESHLCRMQEVKCMPFRLSRAADRDAESQPTKPTWRSRSEERRFDLHALHASPRGLSYRLARGVKSAVFSVQ